MASSSYKSSPTMPDDKGSGRGIVVGDPKDNKRDFNQSNGTNLGLGFMIIGM